MAKFLSGRQRNLSVGINSFTEDKTVLDVVGKVGIGTTNAQNHSLFVVGDTNVVGDVNITGVSTFIGGITGTISTATKLETARTFEITGDVVASPITFDGTGNVSLAATIQPNSVGLGTDTFGDYVESISGTTNEITVTGGTGEGSTPVISFAPNPTISGNVTIGNDLQVNNNLNVTGNITVGGTAGYILVNEFRVTDADIVLGFTTDISGNDVSNDTTANHGGIAVASTEGNPLITLTNPGVGETLPATYKKIMWFKAGSFAGLNTDAWLSNYAIGIGSTQFPSGTRLAAGSVQFTENDLAVVRNINASGIITAPQFIGTASTASFATTAFTLDGVAAGDLSVAYARNSGIATNVIGGIASVTQLSVSGITTLSSVGASQLNVSGVTTSIGGFVGNLTGTATTATNLADAANITTGTINSARLTGTYNIDISGNAATADYADLAGIATYANTAGVATYASNAGVATDVVGGIASVTQLSVSGVSTLGVVTAGNIFSTGIVTALTFVGNLTGTALSISGISTLGTVQVSSGIITATSGVVTYYGDGSNLQGIIASGAISVQDEGITVGAAVTTLNFSGATISVSNAVGGISTVTVVESAIATYASTAGIATYATTAGIATTATNIDISATSSGDTTTYVVLVGDNVTGGQQPFIDNGSLTYNASTNVLTAGGGFSGDGSALTSLNGSQITSGTIPGDRGVTSGSSSSSFIEYNGTTKTAGQFDGGTTDPSSTTRLNYDGYLYATRFYGDGSQLTGIQGGLGISTNTTNQAQYIPYATSFGSTTGAGATTLFVYNPSTNRLGIGTTSPQANLHVVDEFLVAAGSATTQHITQRAYELENGSLSWEGSAGQLFSITNNLTSGSIFSVNDVSGIPSIDVNADGTIQLAPYADGNVGIATTRPTSRLHVVGNALITGISTIANLRVTPVGTGATVGGIGVTYHGDGSQLTGISASGGVSISTNTTNQNQFLTYSVSTGSTTGLGVTTTSLVFNPSTTRLGIGTTNPVSTLDVRGDISLVGVETYSTTIQSITATADRFISFPDQTGVVALVKGINGAVQFNDAGYAGGGNLGYANTTGTFGYLSGGDSITQSTNKSTGVALTAPCGRITMNNANLSPGIAVTFTMTNGSISSNDLLILNHVSGGTAGSYSLNAQSASGSANINVTNIGLTTLGEAIVIGFAVIKTTI